MTIYDLLTCSVDSLTPDVECDDVAFSGWPVPSRFSELDEGSEDLAPIPVPSRTRCAAPEQ